MGQFLCESVLYAFLAMVLAIILVHIVMPSFRAFLDRNIVFNIWLFPALGVAILAVTCMTGVVAGAYPAFLLSSFRPVTVMKGGTMKRKGDAARVRRVLVTIQFAILIALMLSTAVIYRQTQWAMNESLRFDKDQVITIARACTAPIKTAVQALPGVKGAACSWNPLGGEYRSSAVAPDGREIRDMNFSPIDIGFFEVYGIAPLAGRTFSDEGADDVVAMGGSINPNVILNETALRKFGLASPEAAIGQTISWRRMSVLRQAVDTMPLLSSRIVGVVPDVSLTVEQEMWPQVYYTDIDMSLPVPASQGFAPYGLSGQTLNVKLTGRNVPEMLQAIDRIWDEHRTSDPRPIERTFIDQQLEQVYRNVTRQMQLFAAFSGLALFIGILGLFGLSAFTAEQRTKEIGIRKAMGAKTADILRLLVWQFAKPVLWANVIAWPAAYVAMTTWLNGFAYHIDLEPWTFLAASGATLAIAVLTVGGHAWLVARTQPVHALRYE